MEPLISKLESKVICEFAYKSITGLTDRKVRLVSYNLGDSWIGAIEEKNSSSEIDVTEFSELSEDYEDDCDEDYENDCDEDFGYETHYRTVVGGAPGLIYKETDYIDSAIFNQFETQYAIDPHPETPSNFKELTLKGLLFRVHQTQGIFYGIKKRKELHVSSDGINFDHVEFPSSPPCENSTWTTVYCGTDFSYQHDHGHFDTDFSYPGSDSKLQGSLYISRHYPPSRTESSNSGSMFKNPVYSRPWYTLFRYDIQKKMMKFILDYCYDLTVVSAEKGILIASYVTNPLEHLDSLEELKIRSVITFNDRAEWESMKGPSGANFGVVNSTWSNDRKPSAPGQLMVYGREGPIEDYKKLIYASGSKFASSLSTYLTRDYGRSWCKVADGIMRWVVGGSGEIVLVYPNSSGDHILYSLDGGMTWNKFFMNIPTKIETSQGYTSRRFLLNYDTFSSYPKLQYYVLSFDPADQKISSETQISDESLSKL